MKRLRKVICSEFSENLKRLILGQFRIHFGQPLKQNISKYKSFESILSLYTMVTLCKKLEKIQPLIDDKTSKTTFWDYFGHPLAHKHKIKIFSK